MKGIDLTKQLKPYKSGWVAIFNEKVVAHTKSFELIMEEVKKLRKPRKDILLVPASKNYFGFVTIVNG